MLQLKLVRALTTPEDSWSCSSSKLARSVEKNDHNDTLPNVLRYLEQQSKETILTWSNKEHDRMIAAFPTTLYEIFHSEVNR